MVGRNIDLYHEVALQTEVFGSRSSYHSRFGQHDDAIVAGTHTNLVFSTNHAVRLDASQFALLDDKLLVAVVEFAAQLSHNHFLTSSDIGGTADNLLHHTVAFIHGRHVHVVAVRVRLTGQHLTHNKTLQTTLDALHLFHCFDFQTHAGERLAHLLGCHVEVNVFLQPFIRNVHILKF